MSALIDPVKRAMLLDLAAARASTALREAGIRVLLLKGPVIARWLYDDGAVRVYGDVDLLVSPLDSDLAGRTLVGLGYRDRLESATERGAIPHARVFNAPLARATELPHPAGAGGVTVDVDLHRTFHGITASNSTFWSEIGAGVDEIRLFGEPIATPGEPARSLLVALHAAVHRTVGVYPLRDLDRALERVSDEVWVEAYSLAVRLQATPALVEGLAMRPEGERLIARLGFEAQGGVPMRLRASSMPAVAGGLDRLGRTPGIKAKTRLLARELFPTPEFMRIWSPLARRGGIHLALAYLWRPVSLLTKLPTAITALRHARRTGAE